MISAGSSDRLPLASPQLTLYIPPLPPGELNATGGPGIVTLSWAAPASFGGEVPTGYRVYRGNQTHRFLLAEIASTGTFFADHDVVAEADYHYHITAINPYGESAPGPAALASPGHPYSVPIVRITHPQDCSALSSGTFVVEWTGEGNGSPMAGYEFRMTGGGWIDMGLATRRSYLGLSNGSYVVEVRGRNKGGGSHTVTVSFQVDTIPPVFAIAEPPNGTITNLTSLTVRWTSLEEGTAFQVRLDGGGWLQASALSHHLSTIPQGHHLLEVEGRDAAGNAALGRIVLTVDSLAPDLLSWSPAGAGSPANSSLVLTFTETMSDVVVAIDPGRISFRSNWEDLTLTCTPARALEESTTYRVTVTGHDLAGNPLGARQWSFTVIESCPGVPVTAIAMLHALACLLRRAGKDRSPAARKGE